MGIKKSIDFSGFFKNSCTNLEKIRKKIRDGKISYFIKKKYFVLYLVVLLENIQEYYKKGVLSINFSNPIYQPHRTKKLLFVKIISGVIWVNFEENLKNLKRFKEISKTPS
jgi:hypothetical protein